MTFKTFLTATAIATLPVAAFAAHVDYNGSLEGQQNGGTVNLSDGPFDFNASFIADDADDDSGNFTFNFVNDSESMSSITLADVTIRQSQEVAGFADGVTTTFGGETVFTERGALDSFSLTELVGAGETVTLAFEYGDAYGTQATGSFVGPDIDFTVSATPVPVPAAGLLLLGGLGGLAAMRRRNK